MHGPLTTLGLAASPILLALACLVGWGTQRWSGRRRTLALIALGALSSTAGMFFWQWVQYGFRP